MSVCDHNLKTIEMKMASHQVEKQTKTKMTHLMSVTQSLTQSLTQSQRGEKNSGLVELVIVMKVLGKDMKKNTKSREMVIASMKVRELKNIKSREMVITSMNVVRESQKNGVVKNGGLMVITEKGSVAKFNLTQKPDKNCNIVTTELSSMANKIAVTMKEQAVTMKDRAVDTMMTDMMTDVIKIETNDYYRKMMQITPYIKMPRINLRKLRMMCLLIFGMTPDAVFGMDPMAAVREKSPVAASREKSPMAIAGTSRPTAIGDRRPADKIRAWQPQMHSTAIDGANSVEARLERAVQDGDCRDFTLTGNDLDGDAANLAKSFAETLPETKINTLILNCDIDQKRAQVLAEALPGVPQIERIDLDCAVDDDGAQYLAETLPGGPQMICQIERLDLDCAEIDDDGAQCLAECLPHTQIKWLFLYDLQISSEGVQALLKILPHTKIEKINIMHVELDEVNIEALAEALPKSKVKLLYLKNNDINCNTKTGLFQKFANVLPKTVINGLAILDNQFGDEGAQILADVLPKTNLKSLSLSDVGIGNAGHKALWTAWDEHSDDHRFLDLE